MLAAARFRQRYETEGEISLLIGEATTGKHLLELHQANAILIDATPNLLGYLSQRLSELKPQTA